MSLPRYLKDYMAKIELLQKIFSGEPRTIWIDNMRLHSYQLNQSEGDRLLVLRSVETTNFDEGSHFYYEIVITKEQWEQAEVIDNYVMIQWEIGQPVQLSVWAEVPVDLETL